METCLVFNSSPLCDVVFTRWQSLRDFAAAHQSERLGNGWLQCQRAVKQWEVGR